MNKNKKEDFSSLVGKLHGKEYEVVGTESIRGRVHVVLSHSACGSRFPICKQNLLLGRGCPNCRTNRRRKTKDKFAEEVGAECGNEYVVLGEYRTNKTPIRMKHNKCGRSFDIRPDRFVSGIRCPKCYGRQRDFGQEMRGIVGEEYTLLTFRGYSVKSRFRHNVCGHVYWSVPAEFLRGCRCPKCRESRGEREVRNFLDRLGVSYKTQYRFHDCRFKKPLPFDFVVFDRGGGVSCLIEFDGRHHFADVPRRESLDFVREKDAIKTRYCKERGIRLIRVPYTKLGKISEVLGEVF